MNALERALSTKAKPRGRPVKSEPGLPELAVAWAFGDVTTSQVSAALDSPPSSGRIYSALCQGFKAAAASGLIVRAVRKGPKAA